MSWVNVRELYAEALQYPEHSYSLILLIEFLVEEKKVLKLNDSVDKLTYYLQDRFAVKLNQHLAEYEGRKKGE